LVDIVKAALATGRLKDDGPASRDVNKVGPERILALVIYQYDIGTVFVFEGICDSSGLSVAVTLIALLHRFSSSIASA
jgi:hypothetical protein